MKKKIFNMALLSLFHSGLKKALICVGIEKYELQDNHEKEDRYQ